MAAAAPKGNHYSHAEIVHIISNADSSPSPLSSELFAPAVRCLGRCPRSGRACCAPVVQRGMLIDLFIQRIKAQQQGIPLVIFVGITLGKYFIRSADKDGSPLATFP